ncbi:hypothetical protein GCM10023079_32700 [Streptomyces chitinivorans]
MKSTPAFVAATVAGVPPELVFCFFLAILAVPRVGRCWCAVAVPRRRRGTGAFSSGWSARG